MKRLMLQASAIALAMMVPAAAGAQGKDRLIEEARPAVSRTLADRLLKREPDAAAALDGSERADPSRVIYTVEISEGKPASFRLDKEPEGARAADVLIKKKISRLDRVQIAGPITPGIWTLQIHGFSTFAPDRPVYWSAHVSRTPN